MTMDWEPRAQDTLRKLMLQLDKRLREAHETRALEAAEIHARAHGMRVVNADAAAVGFVKAASSNDKPAVKTALRRVGLNPERYEDFF
ncbi:MAG: hypothetical protein ABR559_04680 [Gemmatimonadota bacterium]